MLLSSLTNNTGPIINLINTKNSLMKSYEKISSGMRINRASDDPAGLVISEMMRVRIGEVSQLIRNIEYQNNKYTTAEGGLSTMQVNLGEIRNVILAASNDGVVTDEMRGAYQNIVNRNIEGFNNTIKNTSYGTQTLLNGAEGSVADVDELSGIDITDPEATEFALQIIDEKIDEVLNVRAEIGAKQKYEFSSQKSNLQTEMINLTASESSIRDTDIAREYSGIISNEIKLRAGLALLAHKNLLSNYMLKIVER